MWRLLALLAVFATALAVPLSRDNTCQSLANCNGHGACGINDDELYCFCNDDWVGTRCQIPKEKWLNGTLGEPCYDSIDCNDHGYCSGTAETVQCNCYPGWYGVRCQIPEGESASTMKTTKMEPSTTTKKPTTTTTTKKPTTTTKKATTTTKTHKTTTESERWCDDDIECHGHGSCYGTNYKWECYCYSGYTGKNCETKL